MSSIKLIDWTYEQVSLIGHAILVTKCAGASLLISQFVVIGPPSQLVQELSNGANRRELEKGDQQKYSELTLRLHGRDLINWGLCLRCTVYRGRKPSVQIKSCADQRYMRERLWEITQVLPRRTKLLCVQSQVICVA